MRAIWNGTIIAESDATVVVEGNHYFPADSVRWTAKVIAAVMRMRFMLATFQGG